ncbi:MAG: hypothetical protein IIZ61_09105 [Lachnospiraceae bacterium]|nr:hypothetical protein [Lachnospiraceae bacterium]
MARPVRYATAKIISIDEALNFNPERVKEAQDEIVTEFGIDDFIEMHRAAEDMLKEVNNRLEDYLVEYEQNRADRETVEKAYCLKISILESMAKRFNPLSGLGKQKLSDAVKCREEFETLVGPMITPITNNNASLFKTVLSEEMKEDILSGRRHALGALRTLNGTTYGAGAIVYHKEDTPVYENGMIVIDWLFVNWLFMGRGIADYLIGELIIKAEKAGMEAFVSEIPMGLEDKVALSYIFGSWQFMLDAGLNRDAVFRLGDITRFEMISKYNKFAKNLSSINPQYVEKTVKNALGKLGYSGYLNRISAAGSYIDKNLSCFVGSENNISALLLAHRTCSGNVRVEYLDTAPGGEKNIPALVCCMIENALMNEDDNTIVNIPVPMEELGEFLETLCPKQLGHYLVSCVLDKPERIADLGVSDVEEILKATA